MPDDMFAFLKDSQFSGDFTDLINNDENVFEEENEENDYDLKAFFGNVVPPDQGMRNLDSEEKKDFSDKNKNYSKKQSRELWSNPKNIKHQDQFVQNKYPKEGENSCEFEPKVGEIIELEADTMIEGKIIKKGSRIKIKELDAEIIDGKMPLNRIMSNDNIAVDTSDPEEVEKFKNSEIGQTFIKIKKMLADQGLLDDFKADKNPPDIKYDKAYGTYIVTSDSGKKWEYNINSNKLKAI